MNEKSHHRMWLPLIMAMILAALAVATTLVGAGPRGLSPKAYARELEKKKATMEIPEIVAPEPETPEASLQGEKILDYMNPLENLEGNIEVDRAMGDFISKVQITLENSRYRREVAVCDAFLASKGSPMTSQGENLVREGRAHGIDWRLAVAISGAETSWGQTCGGRSYAHNAWGWMEGRSQESWEKAIPGYYGFLNRYYGHPSSPYEMNGYAASNHPWMEKVAANIASIQEFERSFQWNGS